MKTKLARLIVLFSLISYANYGQNNSLEIAIKQHDSIFWTGYNSCNIETFKKYITDDFEFYHDKGGLTSGADAFLKMIDENLCNKTNTWSLRREVVKGSEQVFPLNNYGAILRGEHVFYLIENGKKEKLIETAKFTHVWKLDQDVWKMSRVLSFDHQPAAQNTDKNEVTLSDKEIESILGNYKAPKTGDVVISQEDGRLMMSAGQMKAQLFPESKTLFFMKQAPLTFEFIFNKKGLVQKMIVREQGTIVEEAIKQ
jgi:hypothetical protein